jgi:hypothetical protein
MRPRTLLQITLLIFASLLVTSCGGLNFSNGKLGSPAARRVLFIGNSFTAYNIGLDKQLQAMDPSCEAARIDVGGYTLQNHWEAGNAVQTIRSGKWNYVVLQEQSQTPIIDQARFREYAAKFDMEIKSYGAKTILLMTWERPDSARQGVTTQNLAAAYNKVGQGLYAQVAPAGLAFARSLRERPDLVLYAQDGHPTPLGTWLATLVVYSTIQGKVQSPAADSVVTPEIAAHFQRVVAETLAQ